MKLPLITTAALLGLTALSQAQDQTGGFLLPTGWTDGNYTTFSTSTRSVTGAPVQTDVTVSGISQLTSAGNIMEVKSFTGGAQFVQVSRSATAAAAGAVQYNIDLSSFDSYLSSNSLQASSIELAFDTTNGGSSYSYDVYLSYTYAPDGITLASIDGKTPAELETDVFAVGNAGTVGTVAGGNFLVLAKDSEIYNLSEELASLYNNGVREFNLIAAASEYGSSRQFTVQDTSGVFLTTSPIPEPSTFALLGGMFALGLAGVKRRRK